MSEHALGAANQAETARRALEEANRMFDQVPEGDKGLAGAALRLCQWRAQEYAAAVGRLLKTLE